ncbi:MAG TPA: hypothetical protein DEB10_11115 [Ruminococcaceae bacterium]|nr:hypothetical protein [Oscillospiraceae bacterium]
MKKIGFIDFYLDEWHANNYPAMIKEIAGDEFTVAYAWAKKDAEQGMTNKQWAEKYGVELLNSADEVVNKSDYLVVLSPDNPEEHEELCKKPFQSGKCTYVDKIFAPDRAAAMRLFELAEKHNTPVFSSSALRFATEYGKTPKEDIDFISSWGPYEYSNYSIHQIEPIVSLMGTEVKKIMSIGTDKAPVLLLQFSDGRQATVNMYRGDYPFEMALSYKDGQNKHVTVQSDFFKIFIKRMLDFFRTGEPVVDKRQTTTVITIIEYGYKAFSNPGAWVGIPSIN